MDQKRAVKKVSLITELSAVLAFSAVQNNDKVRLILFSDKMREYIAPSKGRNQTLRIREIGRITNQRVQTSINTAVQFLNNVVKKRMYMFLNFRFS
ncbi:MAG: VWA domain-containing protein [Saprospiraceae bacterium]|uniref:VWA domain-containing protein n=1 Tax=Candidatus Brachybacter algidus TaxID=2982024 RepID=UPI002579A61F|nr:VWA domain-containing protein [Candidatus Brachybacter algidus]MBK7605155.1 VWA domain-containing protein [Candidatus Brachybacter algidus]